MFVMLVPTILAEDCPHFLRAVGVLPVAAVYPALGLEWAHGRLRVIQGARIPPWPQPAGRLPGTITWPGSRGC